MTVCLRRRFSILALLSTVLCTTAAQATIVDISATVGDWIREDSPTTDSSSENAFTGALAASKALRGVLSYDLTGFSVGDIVNGATVSVYHRSNGTSSQNLGPATDTDVLIHLASQTLDSTATWTEYSTGNNWATLGGDFGAALDTTSANVDTIDLDDEVAFSSAGLTAAIQSAIDNGDASISFVLTAPALEAAGNRDFFAFAGDSLNPANDIARGPNLNVDFTRIPEPATLILLICAAITGIARRKHV